MPPTANAAAPPGPAIEYLTPVESSDFPTAWYEICDPENFWFQWRMRALQHCLAQVQAPLTTPWRVLDIGCGAGITRQQLASFAQWTVDGTDLNVTALRAQVPLPGRVLYYNIMERRPELVGRYDVVILLDVIEHIEPTRPFLEAALAHLRPGGLLLVNVPALMSLFSNYDRAAGHYRRYTPATLTAEFAGLPVDCLHAQYWGMAMMPLAWVRKFMVRRMQDPSAVIRRGFAPPSPLAHALLRTLMRLETTCLGQPPVGTSVAAVLRKHA